MELKVFNRTSDIKIKKATKPRISFSAYGLISLNKDLINELKISPGDLLEIAHNEANDWYIKISKEGEGFVLKENSNKTALCCNSRITTSYIRNIFTPENEKVLSIKVVTDEEESGWYFILGHLAYSNKK